MILKKKLLFLTFSLVLFSVPCGLVTEASDIDSVIIESGIVTEEVENYTFANFQNHLYAILLQDKPENINVNDYVLGQGINILNSFESEEFRTIVYPVYLNGKVVYTYMVKKDEKGVVHGSISSLLAKEFNTLFEQNPNSQIKLFNNGYDIYYTINNEEPILFYKSPIINEEHKNDKVEETAKIIEKEKTELVDTSEEVETSEVKKNTLIKNKNSRASGGSSYNYSMINVRIYENQSQINNGQNEWCMAFALAMIQNSKKEANVLKAETIVRDLYPNNIGTNKFYMNGGISNQQVINYSKSKLKMNPYFVNRPLTLAESRNEFNKYNPVFVFAKVNFDSNAKYSYHALVAYGWLNTEPGKDLIYMWNPWYASGSVVDGGVKSPVLPFPGGQFTWVGSIRNFQ